jgi:long-subunit fatty acid transport protein
LGNTAINGNLNQSGNTLESGALREWVFSGAIEAEKNFFVGVNISILSGKYTNDREYFEDDTKGIYYNVALDPVDPLTKKFQSFELKNSLNWEITGWDVKFGLLYQLQKIARFGITVQLPKTYTIKEEFITEGASSFGTGKYYSLDPNDYTDKVEYDVVTPFTFAGGASVNIEGLIVSADATLIDYTQTKFDNASGISGTAVSAMNKDIKDNLRAVVNYNAGLEYFIPRTGLRLRAGYFIQRSPYLDDPSQYDRQYYSFGAGAMISDNAMVDLAYMHGWWDDIGDNYGYKLSRTAQKLTSENISLSLHYRF